jgi:hypothetical protein
LGLVPPLPLPSHRRLTFVVCHLSSLPPLAAPSSLLSPLVIAASPGTVVVGGLAAPHGFVACPVPIVSWVATTCEQLLAAGVQGAAGRGHHPVMVILVQLMGVCHHTATPRAGARGSGGGGSGGTSHCLYYFC